MIFFPFCLVVLFVVLISFLLCLFLCWRDFWRIPYRGLFLLKKIGDVLTLLEELKWIMESLEGNAHTATFWILDAASHNYCMDRVYRNQIPCFWLYVQLIAVYEWRLSLCVGNYSRLFTLHNRAICISLWLETGYLHAYICKMHSNKLLTNDFQTLVHCH